MFTARDGNVVTARAVDQLSTDGAFAVVWSDRLCGFGACAVSGRRFQVDGRPQGGTFVVTQTQNLTAPAVVVDHLDAVEAALAKAEAERLANEAKIIALRKMVDRFTGS